MHDDPTVCGPEAETMLRDPHSDETAAGTPGQAHSRDESTPSASSEEPRNYPSSIGPYHIVRRIGHGGMGVVYEAEQSNPRRRVALKVIREAWANPELLRRFEQESQALGRLHHPGIAQIYEAGSAATDYAVQPYFAMELIEGIPLVEYADQKRLDTRQRLELMIQVCEAVQHAHQRGIIHRDLKPGNILVEEGGQPKILDFGLARATDSDAQATRQTDVGQLLGTLAYMSPEQVLADPLAVDTRSDVYALGVILYELLAGKMPYTLSAQLHEAVHTIQQTDAAPLSAVSRLYRGDIETIVAKALEKDKSRRYASASELAADIRRYLSDQPITAKPASSIYQLQKFARRNRALVAGVAAVFIVLVLGIVASSWEAVKARRAEKIALQQTDIAKAVNDFLQDDVLAQASAMTQFKPDPDLKVRTALDRAAQNIQGKFGKQPAVEAEIRTTIGSTYYGLGLYAEARAQQESALALQRSLYGPDNIITIKNELNLAKTEEEQGKFAEADQLNAQTLDLTRRVFGPDNLYTISAMNQLTSVYDQEGKFAQGAVLGQQALEISRRVLGPDAIKTLNSEFFLAIMLYEEGKYAEAETLGRHTIEARSRVEGPENPDTLSSMNNLAEFLDAEGKVKDAETVCRQTYELRRKVLGPEHPDTLDTLVNLATILKEEDQFPQAEALDRQALDIQKRVLGPEHPLTLRSMDALAIDARHAGRYAEAESINTSVLAIRRRTLGNDNPDTLTSMAQLADGYRLQEKYAQAEAFERQAFEGRRRVLGKDSPDTLAALSFLALDLDGQQKFVQAEDLYKKALQDSPDNPSLLNGLAYHDASVSNPAFRRPQEALDLARRAVKAAPDNSDNLETLGLAEIRNSLWDDAVATLTKATQLDQGSNPAKFFYLAMACQGRHSNPEAKAAFQRGVELARKRPVLQPALRAIWTEAAASIGVPGPPRSRPPAASSRPPQTSGQRPDLYQPWAQPKDLHGNQTEG
jgi:tetratricopeptide (TPR) repeat protein